MIAGKKVVVTGVIPGHSRETAQEELRAAGAFVQGSVTKETDILVTGARVGATKINKAKALGVLIITWDELWPAEGDVATFAPTPAPVAKAPARRQVGPMLANAGDLPIGDKWRYEVKWDGYRCVATVKGGVHMASRSDKTDYTAQFPHIAAALAELPDCVIDGELVAFEADGTHSFAGLTNIARTAPVFMVFDMIEYGADDLRGQGWSDRRLNLEALADVWFDSPLLVLSPVFDDGAALLAQVEKRGLEGVVAKPVDSTYREGSRKEWVKVKVRLEQEFVVVGWTDGKGNRGGEIGALHLAVHGDDISLKTPYEESPPDWVYVGKVGTGKDLAFWNGLKARLDLHPVDEAPVDVSSWAPADRREAYWVEPELVVQVRFQRWTEDGRLWHPSLQGVREDKPASEVRR